MKRKKKAVKPMKPIKPETTWQITKDADGYKWHKTKRVK